MQPFKQWPTITPHGADASALEKPTGGIIWMPSSTSHGQFHYIESLLLPLCRERDGWSNFSGTLLSPNLRGFLLIHLLARADLRHGES